MRTKCETMQRKGESCAFRDTYTFWSALRLDGGETKNICMVWLLSLPQAHLSIMMTEETYGNLSHHF